MGTKGRMSGKEKKADRLARLAEKQQGPPVLRLIGQIVLYGWVVLGAVFIFYAVRQGKTLFAASATFDGVEKYEVLSAGDGTTFPEWGDTVMLHYTARVEGNKVAFDSTQSRGMQKMVIGENKFLQGMEIAAKNMSLGEEAKVKVASRYGFGKRGSEPSVPPNSDLDFEMLVVCVNDDCVSDPYPADSSMPMAAGAGGGDGAGGPASAGGGGGGGSGSSPPTRRSQRRRRPQDLTDYGAAGPGEEDDDDDDDDGEGGGGEDDDFAEQAPDDDIDDDIDDDEE